jgi:hypothetical protein
MRQKTDGAVINDGINCYDRAASVADEWHVSAELWCIDTEGTKPKYTEKNIS